MPWTRAADGCRIHFEVTGRASGAPVLLIQGLGAEKNSWNIQRAALALRWRTVALDNRGAGRSDKPAGPYDLEQMADDAVAVMDAAGVDAAHVVGLSMGGAISQILALTQPDRVRSLTLIATACRNHRWRGELLAGWAEDVSDKGTSALGREAARWLIGPRSFRRLLPALGLLGPLGVMSGGTGFVSQVHALLATDDALARELGNIDCPTMVMVGNQDILTPRGDAEEIARSIPTAELVVISGAAHGLHIEHALTVNRLLLDFLGRAEAVWVPHGDAARVAV
jgi:3-oxoadipate enol-lactonase